MDDLASAQFLELERVHWWFEGRRRVFFALLRRHLEARGGLKILDVGCGVGGMLEELRAFGEPAGLEISLPMLRLARERGFPRVFRGSAQELCVADRSLDLITAFDCLEHLDDDDRALSGFHRALKHGGHLFLSVPAFQFLYAQNDRVAQHKRRYRRSHLVQKLRSRGFEPVKATYVNALLFPAILPAVLFLKLRQIIAPPRSPETNLSYLPPRWINAVLARIFGLEAPLLRTMNFPAGHSIAILARKA